MKQPRTIREIEQELAATFGQITGLQPTVQVVGKDAQQRVVVAVHYPGDELIKGMQLEAFIVSRGDSILHRSQRKEGNTVMVYRTEPKNRP